MKELVREVLNNTVTSILPTFIFNVLLTWIMGEINKKEWIVVKNLWLRIYMNLKPIIDILISLISYFIFAIIGVIVSVITTKDYINIIMIVLNIVAISVFEMLFLGGTENYIYDSIRIKGLRMLINVMYHCSVVFIAGVFWSLYLGNTIIGTVCEISYLTVLFFGFFYKPVNKKINKYVDIFTDTRKSYLNVESKNISQKGQWYYIKEETTIRKIRKDRVSEFVCHD